MTETTTWRAVVLAEAGEAWQLEETGYAVPWTRQAAADAEDAAAYTAAHAQDRGCLIPDCPVCAGEEPPADGE